MNCRRLLGLLGAGILAGCGSEEPVGPEVGRLRATLANMKLRSRPWPFPGWHYSGECQF